MLLIDVMAGKTSDILEALAGMDRPRTAKHRKDDIKVRAYVVGAYFRRKPQKKVIDIETLRKQRAIKRQADRLLKERA